MNASGCGVTVKDYGHALAADPAYADKARRISELTRDLSELLPQLVPALKDRLHRPGSGTKRLAFHPPCTLQHGQQLKGGVESALRELGLQIACAPHDSHLCCGSAGTYSILQLELSQELLGRKLTNLLKTEPQEIVSGNVGCINHLQSGTDVPVRHWIELVDRMI